MKRKKKEQEAAGKAGRKGKKAKDRFTYAAIAALAVIVIAIPAWMYASDKLLPQKAKSKADYCGVNGYYDVYPCRDGSFQAVRNDFTEGFTIVKPDGSSFACPFTLPQYQVGDCVEYSTGGMCGYIGNICGTEGSCISDADCTSGKKCTNWTCS